MPNWCSNSVKISGSKEQIDALEKFLNDNNGKDWFDFFRPIPPEYKEGELWYGWSINNWGCKWNCDAADWSREDVEDEDVSTISFSFDSPWGPPIALYEAATEDGYYIEAYYLEEGMGFVGKFEDGFDDYNEFDLADPDSLDLIDDDIIEFWDLKTRLEDWQDENPPEEDDE